MGLGVKASCPASGHGCSINAPAQALPQVLGVRIVPLEPHRLGPHQPGPGDGPKPTAIHPPEGLGRATQSTTARGKVGLIMDYIFKVWNCQGEAQEDGTEEGDAAD